MHALLLAVLAMSAHKTASAHFTVRCVVLCRAEGVAYECGQAEQPPPRIEMSGNYRVYTF